MRLQNTWQEIRDHLIETLIPVCTKPIYDCLLLKSIFLVSSDHRSQSHLKFQSMSDNWICCSLFLDELWEFLLETLTIFFKDFWPRDSTCSAILQLWSLGESIATQNSPPHRALGRYRHTSSSRLFRYILCWLDILNYWPWWWKWKFSLL